MNKVKALIICGDGLNCEIETAAAFKYAGAETSIMHINDLIENPQMLLENHIFAIPGGFSFGDEINSGKILGLKIKHYLKKELEIFIAEKKLILGICNGFQTLVKLGLLPNSESEKILTLDHNEQGQFINKWTDMKINADSICIWTKGLPETFSLPIRHGEGKVQFKGNKIEQENYYNNLVKNKQIPINYCTDVNGSYNKIAGICDPTGRIFALMPHPEAATNNLLRPFNSSNEIGIGHYFFKNAIDYVAKNLMENH